VDAAVLIAVGMVGGSITNPVTTRTANAQPRPAPTVPPTMAPTLIVALAPMNTLGAEDTSATAHQFEAAIEKELAGLGTIKLISTHDVVEATKKAKKPALRACDGNAACLTELGGLVGANLVVFGEVGGLGDVQFLSLGSIDVATGKEQRRVRGSLALSEDGGVAGTVTRLMAPDKFAGQLGLTVSVAGASIYVDGKRIGKSPMTSARLLVGTHALRITHPEHRDYVRFVDIGYGATTAVDVKLEQFASIESSVESTATPIAPGAINYVDGPPRWYRRWWAIAGFAAVAVGGAIVVGAAIDQSIDADGHGTVTPP
jgi:PEGA domain